MPREYHHIQNYEKEILQLKSTEFSLSILDGCVIFTFFVLCLVGGYAYMKG